MLRPAPDGDASIQAATSRRRFSQGSWPHDVGTIRRGEAGEGVVNSSDLFRSKRGGGGGVPGTWQDPIGRAHSWVSLLLMQGPWDERRLLGRQKNEARSSKRHPAGHFKGGLEMGEVDTKRTPRRRQRGADGHFRPWRTPLNYSSPSKRSNSFLASIWS